MSGATHTSGPWRMIPRRESEDTTDSLATHYLIKANGARICVVDLSPYRHEQRANAALIAAAPAMLQATERVLKWVEPIAGDNRDEAAATEEIESVAELRAAISRARLEHKEAKP